MTQGKSAAPADEATDAGPDEAPAPDAVAELPESDAAGGAALAGTMTMASEAGHLTEALASDAADGASDAADGDPVTGVGAPTPTATPLRGNPSPADGEAAADAQPAAAMADPSALPTLGAIEDSGEETSGAPARSPQHSSSDLGRADSDDARPGGTGGAAGEDSAPDGGANGESSHPSWMHEIDAALSPAPDASAPGAAAPAVAQSERAGVIDPSLSPAIDPFVNQSGPTGSHVARAAGTPQDPAPPEARFAAANHEDIVKGMRAEVLPNGGTMRIRLDPPQLGALQVTVEIRDGMVTAAFETSNDEATRLLGHSLNQLKAVLESHGVGVDKLQVQQAPREERPATPHDDPNHPREQTARDQEQAARQEQQRKEMLRRMWRQLAGGDPLDVTI